MARLFTAGTNYLSTTTAEVDYKADYTWSAWYRFPTITNGIVQAVFKTGYYGPSSDWPDADTCVIRHFGSGGLWQFESYYNFGATGDSYFGTGGEVPEDTWFHVAIVRSGSALRLYQDGVLLADLSHSLASARAVDRSSLFEADDGSTGDTCLVEGIKAWSRALTLAEIQREMRTTLPVSKESLHLAFPLVENAADGDADDWSGNSRDWTETGALGTGTSAPGNPFDVPAPFYVIPAAAGGTTVTGTGAITLPVVTQSASGRLTLNGSGAPEIPVPTQAATGVLDHPGSGAVTLPIVDQAATGQFDRLGSGEPTLPMVVGGGSGRRGHPGTGNPQLPVPVPLGGGRLNLGGSGTATLPLPTSTGSGETSSGVTGSGSITLPLPETASIAGLTLYGTSGITLPLPQSSASGRLTLLGSGAATLPVPDSVGVGSLPPRGSGAPSLPIPSMAGSGTITAVAAPARAPTVRPPAKWTKSERRAFRRRWFPRSTPPRGQWRRS